MNDTMRALANLLVRARDVLSAAGRSHLDTDAHIPETEFDALEEAVDRCELLSDLDDMADTEASVGGDLRRGISRGAGR